ncbi:D,D-heptose 1,7-bisphosphate phosphatase [Lederbergia ruris]|uniref:D,D-heptose 1,7-bisphosphate phosphatase n=1 Tax=Lederbergia ruris TaxID=217495 RepID=A0ABQ4KPS3_9BACI|nr:HAD-IIIA family hydrolase [Lederbergia ruris]GIN59109.1 D,D-heptose 1,7-bisphosphate phosphatase [Lederbergia ruris]
MSKWIQAVFLDRDGTIGGHDQVVFPGEFELYPNAVKAIERLKEDGIPIYSFTNQPGIAAGKSTERAFHKELKGFGFDAVYLCPHRPDASCLCRKPASGLLEKAADEHQLDLEKCVVIGDRWTDLMAAHEVGCLKVLVKTGAGYDAYDRYCRKQYFGKWAEVTPDYIAQDVLDAVNWLNTLN